MIGTHVERSRRSSASSRRRDASGASLSFSGQSPDQQLDALAPATTSGESAATYRRRTQQGHYVESVRRRARRRHLLMALVAAVLVVGVALGAGFLAFRGVIGSEMALKNSDAREALSAPSEGDPCYSLMAVELGSIAQPLDQPGPDMIVLVYEDREAGRAAFLGIPASLKVTVDNDTHRLADMAANGDASLISAVESYAKVDVSHFVKVDEEGVAGIVDALGGMELTFDQVIDDPHAGDIYYPIGTYTLNGQGALTYLRANNLKMGKGDQIHNQLEFAKLVLSRLLGDERAFSVGIEAIDSYFQTDLTLGELESFAAWVSEIGIDNIMAEQVPGYFTVSSDIVGDNGELYVSKPAEFAELVERISAGDTSEQEQAQAQDVDPSSFTVEVRNGTDIAGAGSATADLLASQGFRITDVGNAEQQVYDETLVVYKTKNTPAPKPNGLPEEFESDEGYADETEDVGNGADGGQVEQTGSSAAELSDEEERALGTARANKVISSLGMGRVVEGDMYYSFDADILLIIGFDYKPVS